MCHWSTCITHSAAREVHKYPQTDAMMRFLPKDTLQICKSSSSAVLLQHFLCACKEAPLPTPEQIQHSRVKARSITAWQRATRYCRNAVLNKLA